MRYVNCHGHSTFSHGDGHRLPRFHVERAASLGYTAMALTEHGSVSSHFQLEKAAIEAGIKPIFGLEAYCGPVGEEATQYKFHLTILARHVGGYQNLNRLVTRSWRDHHYHPTVSGGNLTDHADGLVVLSGCSGSLLACSLLGGKGIPEPRNGPEGFERARVVAERFRALFGEWYFLEVQPFWELEKTNRINTAYERLSKILGIPLIATCDVHYPFPEDSEMQAILHATHRGKHTVEEMMREWNYAVPMTLPESDKALGERLMKTGLSREAAWEAILSSEYLGKVCTVTLPKAERLRYPITEGDHRPWR